MASRTPVLGNFLPDYATGQLSSYDEVLELEQQTSASFAAIDRFAGYLSSSLVTFEFNGTGLGRLDLMADGARRGQAHYTLTDRIIESVGVQCLGMAGSDVPNFTLTCVMTSSAGLSSTDIFNMAASPLKPHFSASLAKDFLISWFTPTSGSAWTAGTTLCAAIVTGSITNTAMRDIILHVRYRHSGSYGDNGLV